MINLSTAIGTIAALQAKRYLSHLQKTEIVIDLKANAFSIHRPAPAVHLPAAGLYLYSITVPPLITVIYSIITITMEAQITNPSHSHTSGQNRFRAVLILTGIVVAIVGFGFLMQDTGFSILPHFAPTTKQLIQQTANPGIDKFTSVVAYLFN